MSITPPSLSKIFLNISGISSFFLSLISCSSLIEFINHSMSSFCNLMLKFSSNSQ